MLRVCSIQQSLQCRRDQAEVTAGHWPGWAPEDSGPAPTPWPQYGVRECRSGAGRGYRVVLSPKVSLRIWWAYQHKQETSLNITIAELGPRWLLASIHTLPGGLNMQSMLPCYQLSGWTLCRYNRTMGAWWEGSQELPDRDECQRDCRHRVQQSRAPCCSSPADTQQTIKMCCSAAVGESSQCSLQSGRQGAMPPAAASILSKSQRFKVDTWTKVVR